MTKLDAEKMAREIMDKLPIWDSFTTLPPIAMTIKSTQKIADALLQVERETVKECVKIADMYTTSSGEPLENTVGFIIAQAINKRFLE